MTTVQDGAESPAQTFEDLDIHPEVLKAVTEVGYETPSAIQAATIPALLAGNDVVGLAQTGTGKTAAFAIPILSKIDPASRVTQALVLAPTRELALQVAEAFSRYGAHLKINVLPIYGGSSYVPQLAGLKRGAQVVVGTPGRVIDHLEKGSLDLSHLDYLVLDEADEMLQMGFAEDVERILADTPEYKQVALFSATMPPGIKKITTKYLHDPVEVTVKSKTQTAENITQRYFQVSYPRKIDALTRLLEVEQGDGMIVFVRTKQATEEVAEKLRARGFAAAAINGDIAQAVRERTISQLKDGTIDILVATDVAARGLDVERISHVVNFDIPHDPESYVHRIGRTGRAGRSGTALLFVTPRERHLLNSIERVTRQKLVEGQLPSVEDVNAQRVEKFRDSITDQRSRLRHVPSADRGLRTRQRRADGRHRRRTGVAEPRRRGVPDDRTAARTTSRAARASRT
jgi:ATP-dependent RNA helicase DeaD